MIIVLNVGIFNTFSQWKSFFYASLQWSYILSLCSTHYLKNFICNLKIVKISLQDIKIDHKNIYSYDMGGKM